MRIDYIEKVGTGIERIKNAVNKLGRGTVEFSFDTFFTTIFSRASHSEKTPKKQKTSVKTSVKIMELIGKYHQITIPEIAEKIGKTTRAVEMAIQKLKQQNRIKRMGPDKGGHWEIIGNDERNY